MKEITRDQELGAMESAAEEIEKGHEWITAVAASAIIRKHMQAAKREPVVSGEAVYQYRISDSANWHPCSKERYEAGANVKGVETRILYTSAPEAMAKDAISRLADKWRRRELDMRETTSIGNIDYREALLECADELEAALTTPRGG